jgi:hypothetical protein
MSQTEMLELLNNYNTMDRIIIKKNLRRIMKEKNIKVKDIVKLGYTFTNVYSWINPSANNIPMFNQALDVAVHFNFDVKEFLKVG